MAKKARLRTRWLGYVGDSAFGWCPQSEEPWAVYVFEIPGVNRPKFYVVGRLMQRPWSRVGGGGEMAHVLTNPPDPEYAFPWPKILGGERARHPNPPAWPDTPEPRYTFDDLGSARAAAQRMADVVAPRRQTRRDWAK